LAAVLPRPTLFRAALFGAALLRPVRALLPGRLARLAALAPARPPAPSPLYGGYVFPAEGPRKLRVALLAVCAQQVLAPRIDEATIRLLTRHGCEVVLAKGAACCGSLTHHMGKDSRAMMRANIDAWTRELEAGGLDAVVVNVSGCGTTVKEYGYLLREDKAYAAKAARISALARDVTEVLARLGLRAAARPTGQRVAYHAACSLQHGQRVLAEPKALLTQAGFAVQDVPEGHLCCGSAGTYNMLEPKLADALRSRKLGNIASTKPEVVAAGNIGCINQLADGSGVPVVHTVELLDWATGGPVPEPMRGSIAGG